jgi:hypothetical protein
MKEVWSNTIMQMELRDISQKFYLKEQMYQDKGKNTPKTKIRN